MNFSKNRSIIGKVSAKEVIPSGRSIGHLSAFGDIFIKLKVVHLKCHIILTYIRDHHAKLYQRL